MAKVGRWVAFWDRARKTELHKLQSRLAKIKAMEVSNEEPESVEQMRQAPHKAVFFWRNTEFLEATRLAVIADRDDLEIYGIDGLNDGRTEMFLGRMLSGVVVDHAAKLTDEQKRNHDWLLCRIAPKEVSP